MLHERRPMKTFMKVKLAFSRAALALLIILTGLAATPAGIAAAGEDAAAARFGSLGHKMICSCGCNQVLLECNHVGCPLSDRMRNELTSGLQRGDSDDLILQSFVQKYGATVLAAPPIAGFNMVAWIMPFVVLLAATAGLMFMVRNWRLRTPLAPAASGPLTPLELEPYREQARRETDL